MSSFRSFLNIFLVFIVLLGALLFVIFNYSWVFSKSVQGEIIELERIPSGAELLSYAILLQDKNGFLYTFSAEDKQWQVVKKGYCVSTTLYRYPPWDLERGGTFYNARLKQIYKCPESAEPAESVEP